MQTAGSTLTAQQPDVNMVRTAIEALAGVLGGAQSLHTNSRDEALSLPTEESARLALRTQQIIAYETGVTNTVDPVGGSEYIEELTDRIEPGRRNTSAGSKPWAARCRPSRPATSSAKSRTRRSNIKRTSNPANGSSWA